jgi:hypothetical protein
MRLQINKRRKEIVISGNDISEDFYYFSINIPRSNMNNRTYKIMNNYKKQLKILLVFF